MKNLKRIFSTFLALALALCLAVPAFAVNITVKDDNNSGSTYYYYRLLDVTMTDDANPADDNTEDTGYAYTVNEKYRTILQNVTNKTTDKEIVEYIQGLTEDDDIRGFADAVYTAIQATQDTDSAIGSDSTNTSNTFADAPQGYYLIAEQPGNGVDAVGSLVMLDTFGKDKVDINTKEEKPSSEKKVKEKNDTTGNETGWQDGADYDIGDNVPFQLTGTLPNDYTEYKSYKIVFHDAEQSGLTFDGADTVTVTCGDTSYTLPHDGISLNTSPEDKHTFDLEIANVKTTFPDATNGNKIVVEYTSTLNEGAVIGGVGNPNEMYMEYSNDHYSTGTGRTPTDKVTVFTFKLSVEKVGNDEVTGLAGAGFTLYKVVPEDTEGAITQLVDGKGNVVKEGYFLPFEVDEDGNAVEVAATAVGEKYQADFKGLDSGNYVLVETTVPDGYNVADPVDITVTATYDTDNADPKLTGLEAVPADFTATVATGTINGKIVNHTGVELPSTGGIGTTLFYVIGGILVAGAAVILFTKKRVDSSEK